MKTVSVALSLVLALGGIGCGRPRLADHRDPEPTPEPVMAKRPSLDPLADARIGLSLAGRDGRVVVPRGQPTMDEVRAFASDGGAAVVSLRTPDEAASVGFDEAAVARRAGLRFVSLPVEGRGLDLGTVEAFGRVMATTSGPVLLHCASGNRAGALWAAHLAVNAGVGRDEAVARGRAVGMGADMEGVVERIALRTPDRVIAAVDAARLRRDVDALAGFGTRHTLSETDSDTRGIGAARRWVARRFEEAVAGSGREGDLACRVEFDAHRVAADGARIPRDVEVVNVVCTIPGADPASRDRLYYAVAHLDSRASDPNDAASDAPGANDDGSGVAALIELARVLSAERLDSTVVLLATSGEEQGLYGARLHARAAREAGLDVRAVLNNDTIGDPTGPRTVRDEVRVFSEGLPLELLSGDPERLASAVPQIRALGAESDGASRQLARYVREVGELHAAPVRAKLVMRPDRFLRGGDHTPFNELGFPAVRLTELYDVHERQHQDVRTEGGVRYGDLPEFVDEVYLAGVTALNAATLAHLANAPSAPGNARIIVAELTNHTTLRWDPSPEPDTAGYEVVWRDTASAEWQHAQDVGDATEGTVARTKDNSVFGVRAYDRDGYRSVVAFPMPARE